MQMGGPTLRRPIGRFLRLAGLLAVAGSTFLNPMQAEGASRYRNCRWDGTGPVCEGRCREDQVAVQTSTKGCWTGGKVKCCDVDNTITTIDRAPKSKPISKCESDMKKLCGVKPGGLFKGGGVWKNGTCFYPDGTTARLPCD